MVKTLLLSVSHDLIFIDRKKLFVVLRQICKEVLGYVANAAVCRTYLGKTTQKIIVGGQNHPTFAAEKQRQVSLPQQKEIINKEVNKKIIER